MMKQTSAYLKFCVLGALLVLAATASSQVNGPALVSDLNGKAFVSIVEIGFDGETANPIGFNGQPVEFPVKTLVYPDGHERIRIEHGILHAEAAKYRTFKEGIQFHVTKVVMAKDNLEIVLAPPTGSTVGDLKVMLESGWQVSMTNAAVIEAVKKYLVTPE